jgi:hypothetical protein
MYDFTELLKSKNKEELKKASEETSISYMTLRNYIDGKTCPRTNYAIRIMEYFGVEPPCKENKIREFVQECFAKYHTDDLVQVCDEIGVCERNARNWLGHYNYTGHMNPQYSLFLLFCKYVDKDGAINKYSFRGL